MTNRKSAGGMGEFVARWGLGLGLVLVTGLAVADPIGANVDNDKSDTEAVTTDPERTPNQSGGSDHDNDGDPDSISVGTHSQDSGTLHPPHEAPEGELGGTEDMDEDDEEDEIVVTDPGLAPGQSYGVDMDGDTDYDIFVIGTYYGFEWPGTWLVCEYSFIDIDGDGDMDAVVFNPNKTPDQSSGSKDVDGDGDPDVYEIGTQNANDATDEAADMETDEDGDGETEVLLVMSGTGEEPDEHIDMDGDGDPDVVVSYVNMN